MSDKAVDACLPALKFLNNIFKLTNKIYEKLV